jgi:glycosyltransferase involved in cell wall biosynthesis
MAGRGATRVASRPDTVVRTATLVHLGRASARGEVQRVAGWRAALAAGGWDVDEIALSALSRPSPGDLVGRFRTFAGANAVFESVSWSWNDLRRRLSERKVDLVIVVSARAWSPEIAHFAPAVVLDLVDPLSVNYSQRAHVASGLRRVALRSLAGQHRRVERRLPALPDNVVVVCAGRGDAALLGATWLPVFLTAMPAVVHPAGADHDAVFIGSLRYEPNIDALHVLADTWPTNRRLLVAGADPSDDLASLIRKAGWTLLANFERVDDVLARAHLAVAPLRIATGLQIKVLDAASRGVPQLVSTSAGAGFEPGFVEAVEPAQLAALAVQQLHDLDALRAQAAARRETVRDRFLPTAMARQLDELLATNPTALLAN